jgi:hypothetical protein
VKHDRLINKISVTASLVLAVTLCTTVGVVFWPRVASALGIRPAPPAGAYVAGDRIDVPASWYGRAPQTLIVFARASCGACQNAQPFLKALAGTVTSHGGAVMIAGHRDTPKDDGDFAASLGLGAGTFTTFPAGLRVRRTPTLVLVDRAGVILAAWEGVGPPEQQREIATAVQQALK